jgi:hypothetical protein
MKDVTVITGIKTDKWEKENTREQGWRRATRYIYSFLLLSVFIPLITVTPLARRNG